MNKHYSTHPFHLVDVSPWPILMSFALLSGAFALVDWLTQGTTPLSVNLIIQINVILIISNWLRDVIREGLAGYHTKKVQEGFMQGFIIFLITEVLLFFSFFWAMLHSSLNPAVDIATWPPLGINAVSYLSLPLLNSVQLLSGGFIATWAHHSYLYGDKTNTLFGLIQAIVLTVIFLIIQYIEYSYSEFSIADSVFGSVFFITTGLHMLHVIFAVIFLGIATIRIYTDSMNSEHALNLDFSLIYYHLVDVVWLLVYVVFYWFGS